MKILLIIAETPYVNEWFSTIVKQLREVADAPQFLLYYNSVLAWHDKKDLFPQDLPVWHCQEQDVSLPENFNWRNAFISWERQTFHKAYTYDAEAIKSIASNIYGSLKSIVDSEQPDFILYELPSSILGEICWFIASQSPSTRYIGVSQSRIPDRIDLYDDKYRFIDKSVPMSLRGKDWVQFNDDFVNKRILPTYMSDKVNSMHRSSVIMHYLTRMHRFKFFARHLIDFIRKTDYETVEAYRMLFVSLKNHLLRKVRQRIIRKHYRSPDYAETYALFPLHLVPESSVSGQAMWCSEMVSTLRYIAFSLPISCMLYVREHPGAVGTRSSHFYRELAKIPNIRLVSHLENSRNLIDHSKCVITLTSTLGMEAALLGKRVYVLGDVFYDFHPRCTRIRNYDELAAEFQERDAAPDGITLDGWNSDFWCRYYSNTIGGNVLTGYGNSEELMVSLEKFK